MRQCVRHPFSGIRLLHSAHVTNSSFASSASGSMSNSMVRARCMAGLGAPEKIRLYPSFATGTVSLSFKGPSSCTSSVSDTAGVSTPSKGSGALSAVSRGSSPRCTRSCNKPFSHGFTSRVSRTCILGHQTRWSAHARRDSRPIQCPHLDGG